MAALPAAGTLLRSTSFKKFDYWGAQMKYYGAVAVAMLLASSAGQAAVYRVSDTFSITYSQPSGPLTSTGISGSYSGSFESPPIDGGPVVFDLDHLTLSTYTFGVNTFDLTNSKGTAFFSGGELTSLAIGGFTDSGPSESVDIANIDTQGDWRVLYTHDPINQVKPSQVDYGSGGQGYYRNTGITGNFKITVVPVPAAVWLFGSALAGLGWLRRRQTA